MKKLLWVAGLVTAGAVQAQQTAIYTDRQELLKEGKEYFQKNQYSLAYPIFKELNSRVKETDIANTPVTVQEIRFYNTACGLLLGEPLAELDAINFVAHEKNVAHVQMMSFHLAEYYFRKQNYKEAINYYDQANIANLTNDQIATMKFHQGYAYFLQKDFKKAKPLFNTIRTLTDDPNYLAANYYYGFLSFRDKQYNPALTSFKIVENAPDYKDIVPYYIAQIYYAQGKTDEALAYAEQRLKAGQSQYYDLEMKQMIGHAYFEQKQFAQALPYLESFVNGAETVRREDLYELSYCYYHVGKIDEAIEGFKQLSGSTDALSQHAMYLLGDAYLKKGQKSNARNAFLFCASNNSDKKQQEISKFIYAKLSYELGYQDEALNGFKSFLNDFPSSEYQPEAKELLVAVLANTNNYREALSLLEKMDNLSVNARKIYPRILYGRATEFINDGRLADAEVLLNKAFDDPHNISVLPFLYYWKGELAYRNNRIEEAITNYQAYINSGAPSGGEATEWHARYNLGYCYMRQEDYNRAISYFSVVAKNVTAKSDALTQDAYVRLADCYYMERQYSKAQGMYNTVIVQGLPSADYATYQHAMIAGIGNSTEKIKALSAILDKYPASALITDVNMQIAKTYMADEKFREAIPYFTRIVQSQGNNSYKPEAILLVATANYNLNDNNTALTQYKDLVKKYPNTPQANDALDAIQEIYLTNSQPDGYISFMKEIGRSLSTVAEDSLTYNAAIVQLENGNTNAAQQALEAYLKKFPEGTYLLEASYYTGELYVAQKKWENAIIHLNKVLALSPNKYAEQTALSLARVQFFELKNYEAAEKNYQQLLELAAGQENQLEARRGLLRSQYQLEKWSGAQANAKELLLAKGISNDDKALANMVLAKANQLNRNYAEAITAYKLVVAVNKAGLAAEARYEIANCLLAQNKLTDAEKAGMEVINKSGSYDFWVVKAYILLGDVFLAQKDYFNAKATFQSVVDNTLEPALKKEAQDKLDKVTVEEGKNSRLRN